VTIEQPAPPEPDVKVEVTTPDKDEPAKEDASA
jgi:hypothetical protein